MVVLPLVQGVLLALVLREVHLRHPLSLGGSLTPPKQQNIPVTNTAEIQETSEEPGLDSTIDVEKFSEELKTLMIPHQNLSTTSSTEESKVPISSAVSVFDGISNTSDNLPITEVLHSMIAEAPAGIPNDFENRIEENALSKAETQSGILKINDDMDVNDLAALAAALPRKKINFAQELETDSAVSSAISPMAKEVLGENFDFEELESQSEKLAELAKAANTKDISLNTVSAEVPLDVQENNAGTVQVSSPFMLGISSQLADFIESQMILPTFSNDWIQETGNTVESIEGDMSKFCFTEESQPMFVRKKKTKAMP